MKSFLPLTALIVLTLGSCNKKSESAYDPQTEREEWKLTRKRVVAYDLPATGQAAYTSNMGIRHDFSGLSIYIRDTVKEGAAAAYTDRYLYNYRVGWVLTGVMDTTGANALPRAMSINYRTIPYAKEGLLDGSDIINYTNGAAGPGRSVVTWTFNDTMLVKIDIAETGVTFPHDRRYEFDPKEGSLIKFGYTPTSGPASNHHVEIVRQEPPGRSIKYVKKQDYRPATSSLIITDSTVYTKANDNSAGRLQNFFRRMARGISWWKTGNGYARMPILARNIPYYVYEHNLMAREENYHDAEDGAGLVKQYERTYAYEMDANGNVSKITVRYNGQLESEIWLGWEFLKWVE